jgi:hypothetical protein
LLLLVYLFLFKKNLAHTLESGSWILKKCLLA